MKILMIHYSSGSVSYSNALFLFRQLDTDYTEVVNVVALPNGATKFIGGIFLKVLFDLRDMLNFTYVVASDPINCNHIFRFDFYSLIWFTSGMNPS